MAVRVTRQEKDLEGLAGEVEDVALVDEARRLHRRDRQLVLLLDGALGVLARHAVQQQPLPEAIGGVAVEPRAHGQVAVDPALHGSPRRP